MNGFVGRLRAWARARREARDYRRRAGYYDGSEAPDNRPPGRYARGERATPAPPPGGF